LTAFGAQIVLTPATEGMRGEVRKAGGGCEHAVAAIEELDDRTEHELSYGPALENPGAAKLQMDRTGEGIDLILKAMSWLQSPTAIARSRRMIANRSRPSSIARICLKSRLYSGLS